MWSCDLLTALDEVRPNAGSNGMKTTKSMETKRAYRTPLRCTNFSLNVLAIFLITAHLQLYCCTGGTSAEYRSTKLSGHRSAEASIVSE